MTEKVKLISDAQKIEFLESEVERLEAEVERLSSKDMVVENRRLVEENRGYLSTIGELEDTFIGRNVSDELIVEYGRERLQNILDGLPRVIRTVVTATETGYIAEIVCTRDERWKL